MAAQRPCGARNHAVDHRQRHLRLDGRGHTGQACAAQDDGLHTHLAHHVAAGLGQQGAGGHRVGGQLGTGG